MQLTHESIASDASQIQFAIHLGRHHMVIVGFLASYSGEMGAVNVSLLRHVDGPAVAWWTIEARCKSSYSISRTDTHRVAGVRTGPYVLAVRPIFPNQSVTAERQAGNFTRFKLLSVSSC